MMGGMMGGMVLATVLGMVLIVVLVIVVIVALLRTMGVGTPRRTDSALQILQERFARGEINHEEYQERRATLQQHQ